MNITEYRQLAAKAMSEAELTAQVIALADDLGWSLRYHLPDSRTVQAGFPDWVLGHPGREAVIYAELKAQNGRITPEQRTWLDVLAAAGHRTFVWRPADLLAGDIARVLEGAQ